MRRALSRRGHLRGPAGGTGLSGSHRGTDGGPGACQGASGSGRDPHRHGGHPDRFLRHRGKAEQFPLFRVRERQALRRGCLRRIHRGIFRAADGEHPRCPESGPGRPGSRRNHHQQPGNGPALRRHRVPELRRRRVPEPDRQGNAADPLRRFFPDRPGPGRFPFRGRPGRRGADAISERNTEERPPAYFRPAGDRKGRRDAPGRFHPPEFGADRNHPKPQRQGVAFVHLR